MNSEIRHPSWCDVHECTVRPDATGGTSGGHASRRVQLSEGATAVQLTQTSDPGLGDGAAPMVRLYDLSRGKRFTTAPLDELLKALAELAPDVPVRTAADG